MAVARHGWRRTPCLLALAWTAVVLSTSDVRATRLRPVNLEEMTAHAKRVFAGRCVAVEAVEEGVVEVTFEVDRVAKGTASARLTVKMAADDSGGLTGVAGMPRFAPGETVVLFLYGESKSGLTSPVGLGQGKFTVVEDKLGRRRAVNAFGNRTLFKGLSDDALLRLGPAVPDPADDARQGLAPGELLDMVETLLN